MSTETVERVCRLPVEYRTADLSWRDLVSRSGWSADATLDGQLAEYLRDRPDLVDAWFGFSQDKRTSPGWYLQEDPLGGYVVGWYPGSRQDRFMDRVAACAEFIRHELGAAVGPAG